MGAHRYHPGMLPCGHVMNVGHRVDRRKVGGCWAHGFGWHTPMSYPTQCRLRVCWPRRVACMVHRSLAWSRSLSLHKYTPYWSQTPWHRLFTFYPPLCRSCHTQWRPDSGCTCRTGFSIHFRLSRKFAPNPGFAVPPFHYGYPRPDRWSRTFPATRV